MPPNAVEAGIKSVRAHYLRETVTGAVQANPAWKRFSDTLMLLGASPNANLYQQRGVGYVNIQNFLIGPEDHAFEIGYHLQNWLDGTNDAASDGIARDSDGGFNNTHAVLLRQELASGGIQSSGRRIYTVAVGGRVGRVSLKGDPNTGEPLLVTLGYVFEKIRSYVIDQPSASGVVTVVSDDAGDTTQTITVEDEGAGTSEDISLNGTTPVAGVTSFADVDSISIDAETDGDITISMGGDDICVILGKTSNGGYEGDLGVPPLASGSFEGALGSSYQQIVGSTIQRGGADLETNATVRTLEIVVDNKLDVHPRLDSRRRRIIPGVQDITAIASIFSEIGSHESFIEHIKSTESNLVWTVTAGTLTLGSAALTGLGPRRYESGRAVMQRQNTFTAKSITAA